MDATAFSVEVDAGRVTISGEIDMATAALVVDAVTKTTDVALDLSAVTFLDSTGLHALIELRQRGALPPIVAVSEPVRRLMDLSGTTDYLRASK